MAASSATLSPILIAGPTMETAQSCITQVFNQGLEAQPRHSRLVERMLGTVAAPVLCSWQGIVISCISKGSQNILILLPLLTCQGEGVSARATPWCGAATGLGMMKQLNSCQ